MRLLVASRHFGYLRNFESALAELARRGHDLLVTADRPEQSGGEAMVRRLAEQYASVRVSWTPPRGDRAWSTFASEVRLAHDHLRYLDPMYADAPRLRERSEARRPRWLDRLLGTSASESRRAMVARLLSLVEEAMPVPRAYLDWLRQERPDLVILTPLIDLGSPQLDLLKAARALGLRTVLAVGSWDHLSSKALIRWRPDLVTVWNGIQLDEAVRMHGLPESAVEVTGAQCYDQWFDRPASRSREEFCGQLGLPADRPLILYVCSAPFRGEPPEADFVLEWASAVRRAGPPLADAAILIRPHPARRDEWNGRSLDALGPIALHGANPIDTSSRDDYFDALHYSAAVVGLNTSAFIEAGVVGRPVHAILAPAFRASQQGTLHFKYLTEAGGGLLRLSSSLEAHLPQLAASVASPRDATINRGFVETFVRPYGLDVPATPRLADAFERVARLGPASAWRPGLAARMARPIVAVLARRRSGVAVQNVTRAPLNARHES